MQLWLALASGLVRAPLLAEPAARPAAARQQVHILSREPVLWLHVHKCAGTLMCELAHAAGEKVVQPSKNCNWDVGDAVYFMGRPSPKPTCAERQQYFAEKGYTWGAVEHELSAGHPCPGFLYGTMLRDPMALVDSIASVHAGDLPGSDAAKDGGAPVRHTADVLGPVRDALKLLATANQTKAGLLARAENRPIHEHIWSLDTWKYFDNFQTRLLADALDVPAGALTADHLRRAEEALDRFDVVLVLEDLQEDAPQLVEGFGWPASLLPRFGSKVNDHPSASLFTADEVALLRRSNTWDQSLVARLRDRLSAARPASPPTKAEQRVLTEAARAAARRLRE